MKIIWDISNKCNLNCKHCGAADYFDNTHLLTYTELENIAKNICKIANYVVLLGGEPFLIEYLYEIIKIFEKSNVKVDFITNGQVDVEYIQDVLKLTNIETIYVSIDGLEEANDLVRGKGSWKKAIIFLDYLLQTKPSNRKVGVATVLNKKNASSIKEFIKFFERKGVNDISFSLLELTGNARKNRNILELSDREIINTLKDIAIISKNSIINIMMDTGSTSLNKYLTAYTGYKFFGTGVNDCGALFENAYCDMNGLYFPCRRYQGKGIDLKKVTSIEDEYYLFDDFLEKRLQGNQSEKQCPLGKSCDKFATVVNNICMNEKMPRLKIKKPTCMYQKENRKYIFYFDNNEYVEYSDIGWKIYKLIKKGTDSNEIISIIGCEKNDFINFIEHEINHNRLEVELIEK